MNARDNRRRKRRARRRLERWRRKRVDRFLDLFRRFAVGAGLYLTERELKSKPNPKIVMPAREHWPTPAWAELAAALNAPPFDYTPFVLSSFEVEIAPAWTGKRIDDARRIRGVKADYAIDDLPPDTRPTTEEDDR